MIVGGGFGGLAVAKALRKTAVRAFLIDRTICINLSCKVATSVLIPEQIASSRRRILRKHTNTTVILGEVTSRRLDAAGLDPWA